MDDDKPLITVVVPCRNREQYIGSTIDSILGQDYTNIECIVVDAASTDGTIDVIKSYGDRIKWISRPDRGAFDAINEGWKMGKGEILAWLNADDDFVVPGAFTAIVNYFIEHPSADLVYGDCGGTDADGKVIWYGPARDWTLEKGVLWCDHVIGQPAAFMRRSIIEKCDYLYPAWGHDHELWIRIDLAGGRIERMPGVHVANGRIWEENGFMNPGFFIPCKLATIQRAIDDPRLPPELKRRKRRIWSNAYVRCMDFLPNNKHWKTGVKLMVKAFIADPTNGRYILEHADGCYALQSAPAWGKIRKGLKAIGKAFFLRDKGTPAPSYSG